jgi:hypothetical protein
MNLYKFNAINKNMNLHCRFYILFICNQRNKTKNNIRISIRFRPISSLSTIQVLGKKEESLNETSLSQMIEPLEGLLQCQGLMTDRLESSPLCTCTYVIYSLIFELVTHFIFYCL